MTPLRPSFADFPYEKRASDKTSMNLSFCQSKTLPARPSVDCGTELGGRDVLLRRNRQGGGGALFRRHRHKQLQIAGKAQLRHPVRDENSVVLPKNQRPVLTEELPGAAGDDQHPERIVDDRGTAIQQNPSIGSGNGSTKNSSLVCRRSRAVKSNIDRAKSTSRPMKRALSGRR